MVRTDGSQPSNTGSTPVEGAFSFFMNQNKVKIFGAGLSGLTAAINLAKAGYKIEVHEKCSNIGEHYKENPQLLPNWFSNNDVIDEFKECGIDLHHLTPIEEIEVNIPNQKIIFYGKEIPTGYVVLRGGDNSLECDLARKAKELGVDIITNSAFDVVTEGLKDEKKIFATGLGTPITAGYGRVYKGSFNPKRVRVFFDPSFSPSIGYTYLFPHNENMATVKTSRQFSDSGVDLKNNLQSCVNNFLSSEIKEDNLLYDFGSLRSFNIPKSAIKENMIFTGEAAGFQDELFRFGMRYAAYSGYFAAKSIIENIDYDVLWKKKFMKEFERTKKVRSLFEVLKKNSFLSIPKKSETIYMDIEKFRKIWLSKKFNAVLSIASYCPNIFLNKNLIDKAFKLFYKL